MLNLYKNVDYFVKKSDKAVNWHGCPLSTLTTSLSVGPKGPLLLQDTTLVDHLAHFDRERIPERVVHAKGAGTIIEIRMRKKNNYLIK